MMQHDGGHTITCKGIAVISTSANSTQGIGLHLSPEKFLNLLLDRLDKQGDICLTQTTLCEDSVSNRDGLIRTPYSLEEFEKVVLTSLQVVERYYSAIEKFCEV